jgi:hypothetical protein
LNLQRPSWGVRNSAARARKGVNFMSKERLFQLRQEAVALIKKGGLSAKIGHAFLKTKQGA